MNIEKNNTDFIKIDSDDNFVLMVRVYYPDGKYTTKQKGVFIDVETGDELGNPAQTFERLYDDNFNRLIPSIKQTIKFIPSGSSGDKHD